jgi:uncharacterized protein YbbK (DUF523 family)
VSRLKIKIGVSSCLLGNHVRYDGGHKLDYYLRDTLGQIVEWVPICPEMEAGLPVPREPMRLLADGMRTRLIAVETGRDRTDILARWVGIAMKRLEQEHVRGFVLKARSPSCGICDTPVFSAAGEIIGERAGLFTEAVLHRFPSLPVEDEERLRDPRVREEFLQRIQG